MKTCGHPVNACKHLQCSLLWHVFHFPTQLVYCDFLLASQKVINHLLYPIVLAQQSCFSILLFCWITCCKLVQTINKPGFHFINIWKPGYKTDMQNSYKANLCTNQKMLLPCCVNYWHWKQLNSNFRKICTQLWLKISGMEPKAAAVYFFCDNQSNIVLAVHTYTN